MTDPGFHPRIRVLHVKPHLPERLEPLRELALNLHWAWNLPTADLFRRLDRDLWHESGHNPARLLGRVSQERLEAAAADPEFTGEMDRLAGALHEYLGAETWFSGAHGDLRDRVFAYFSAEFGITECIPFYSGGLGVLAGDHLKSASELGLPLVGVGLAYSQGYFMQYLNVDGWQQETYRDYDFSVLPISLERDAHGDPLRVSVAFPGREVAAQVWRVQVGRVPLYLLDANLPENSEEDRAVTRRLYGGGSEMRIQQEILLGVGGLRALAAVGIEPDVCHMNEGHAAFLCLERIRRLMTDHGHDFETARCLASVSGVFTTHTPVPAGFDLFEPELVERYFADFAADMGLSWEEFLSLGQADGNGDTRFNMALLAARHATYRNGVSKLHGEVSRRMMRSWWPGYPEDEVPVESVTNGVHMRSWIAPELQDLLHRYVGTWTQNPADSEIWRGVESIPDEELWAVHQRRKERLVDFARERLGRQVQERGGSPEDLVAAGRVLDPDVLTIGFARRFAAYKRADLLLRDLERLKAVLLHENRRVQFVYAGKAHPADDPGKEIIKRIHHFSLDPDVQGSVVFLENYDINVGRHLVQGVDVWLNNPRRPLEASGTSGMKAAANGVLNLSVLDGWWDEGYDAHVGWAIGHGEQYDSADYQDTVEANALYDLLERDVPDLYYARGDDGIPHGWVERMKQSIARLCWRFNTNRMVTEYADRFYVPAARRGMALAENGGERARDLVAWTSHVREHWDAVEVRAVEQIDGHELHAGSEVEVRATVHLGELSPDDVRVEVYFGPTDAEEGLRHGTTTALERVAGHDGDPVFQGRVTCPESGLYGYAVRVRPRHADALVNKELPLITWY